VELIDADGVVVGGERIFEVVINLRASHGRYVSASPVVLLQANQVIREAGPS
jgi:hypothetical protein